MDTFIVSARKYRPQNFATVVGQAHITTTLKNAINNNQLAHAFLFTGPRGVGKTTCARILAKTINCEKRSKEGEACNTCNSCVSFDNGTSMNIHELDAASNNSVDDIRALVEQVRFAPQAGKYKVYIIDEVHMLSSAAFNAFLKTLEEPPHYAIFILATTEKHKILPTILSRCQIFDFKRITINDTIEHLQEICDKEKIKAEKAALHVIAQKSEGCMRDALSILDKIVSFTGGQLGYTSTLEHLNILDEDYYFRLLEHLQAQQLPEAMLLFDEINQKGFEGDTLLEGFAEFLRNLLVSKDPKAAVLLEVAEDFKKKYAARSALVPTGWLIGALNMVNDSSIQFKTARNKRLHIELLLIKLAYLGQAIQLVSGESGIIKKKLTEDKAVPFRNIPIIAIRENTVTEKKPAATADQPRKGATLVIETPKQDQEPPQAKDPISQHDRATTSITAEAPAKIGSLSRIRQQIIKTNQTLNPVKSLTLDSLQEAWKQIIEKMIAEKSNQAAINNFSQAKLEIVDDNLFSIISDNILQQKFIESERAGLIDHMQSFFNNKYLTFQLLLDEKEVVENTGPKPPTIREQYNQLAAQYPMIRELKERLKLELGS